MRFGDKIQRAMFAALTAADLGDVYDRPPADRTYPHFTIGDEQVIDDGDSCGDAWEVFEDVHVWDQPDTGSKVRLKQLMAAAEPVLAVNLEIAGFRVVSAVLETARSFRDPDGITEHGVMTFKYLIDAA